MAKFGLLLIRLEHRWNCLFWEDLIGGNRRARMKVSHSIFHRETMRGDLINSVFSRGKELAAIVSLHWPAQRIRGRQI